MNRMIRLLGIGVCVFGLASSSQAGFSLGGKIWVVGFADPMLAWRDNYSDGYSDNRMELGNVVLIGPKFEWTFDNSPLWISGMLLAGTTEGDISGSLVSYAWGTQVGSVSGSFDFTLTDAEILFGYSYKFVDVGVGIRHTKWVAENMTVSMNGAAPIRSGADVDVTIMGPMAYAGAGAAFGESPFGWYVGGSFMFLDVGDAENGEHFNVEAGLFYSKGHLSGTAGYRVKKFINYDDANSEDGDTSQSGVALSASYAF